MRFAALAEDVLSRDPRCGATRVVCVDGPSGSGKTRFARRLARALGGAPVVPMDDVYDGWDDPLRQAFVDRLTTGLLDEWAAGRTGSHPVYDWSAGRFAGRRQIPPAPVVLLEGVGAASAGIRARAVLVVWVEASDHVRLDRAVSRDGPRLRARLEQWQRREAGHFERDGTRSAATLLVDGAPVIPHDPEEEFVRLDRPTG
jgi:uridine kinase